MSKKKDKYDDEYEGRYEPGYKDNLRKHRKNKKMKNALRSNNIEDLIDEDDILDDNDPYSKDFNFL